MSKTNGNNKKAESIKALIHIEDNEPYVKLIYTPSAGSLGFEIKQKTQEEAFKIANAVLDQYDSLIKKPKVEQESFI